MTVILLGLVAVVAVVRFTSSLTGNRSGVTQPPSRSPGAGPGPTTSAAALPRCAGGDRTTRRIDYADWGRTLVDTTYRLPEGYRPPDLVSVTDAGFPGDGDVRAFVIGPLEALRRAAAAAGTPVEIAAAYRSFEQQAALLAQRIEELGEDAALQRVARPGHSEHQLGTTVDFKTAGEEDVEITWASTPAGAWTLAHAARYGFVLSYPEDADDVTCYRYEPWHFRYVGEDRAAAIVGSGLTLREFLWREDVEG